LPKEDSLVAATEGADLIVDGMSVAPDTILCHSRNDEFIERTTGPVDRGILSLPIEDMARVSTAFSPDDFAAPEHPITISPPRAAMERLIELHIATDTLARHAPHVLANDDAARGLEQSLIEAMEASLGGDAATDSSIGHSRRNIMRQFQQVLEENIEEPMYVPEICKALGMSERGLRHCCEQYLNMSPKQFLTLRRMHMAHRALRSAANPNENVTEIAMRFGFWHLGRFAVAYRSVFGESPSATLKRAK
jgi:AraC-like DNA-binding protein